MLTGQSDVLQKNIVTSPQSLSKVHSKSSLLKYNQPLLANSNMNSIQQLPNQSINTPKKARNIFSKKLLMTDRENKDMFGSNDSL